ncbi:chemotaxis protein CheA, partial [bacterium]|nr:chemotaxis protein CheA [bacterium]
MRELRQLGECLVVAHTDWIPEIDQLDPENCYLCWDIILTTEQGRDAIEDVFIFVADDCRLTVEVIDAAGIENEVDYKHLGEILVERGDLKPEDLAAALAERRRLGDLLVEKDLVTAGQVAAALTEQARVQQMRESRKGAEAAESIRVKSEKLDSLVNLIGELVTVQARLSQIAQDQQMADLLNVSEVVERLTWELRDQVLTIRMLPIGATFNKFRRLVHDLSQELGKNVQLVTEGAETELDKTVIERLNDPLVHLVRNSIDHGIESPGQREAAGKPRHGKLTLAAAHVGANVVLKISDDGAGIDRVALRRTAEAMGLIAPGSEVAEREL